MSVSATTAGSTAPLGRGALLAYGAPALPLAALTLPVYIYLPTVYATGLELGLGLVGALLLAARLWDVVTDPLIGSLSDRWRGRFGRRRPWVAAGAPLVMVGVWFLFRPGDDAGGTYLLIWSLVLYLGWTMMILPLSAWGAELSFDYNERSRIAGYREAAVLIGTLVALGLPAAFGYSGLEAAKDALALLAWVLVCLVPVTVAALLRATPEPRVVAWQPLTIRRSWSVLAANGPFRRLVAAYLLNGIANGLPATLFLLFASHVLQAPEMVGVLLVIYFLSGFLALPVWVRLSYRFGKHRVWSAAMVFACAVFVLVPLLGPGDVWWFVVVCVLTGLCLGADLVLPSSMQADVVDLDTSASGAQRTGLYFALWGMATKLALALAVGIAFPLLDLAGFDQDGGNDGGALFALTALYSLAPVIFKAAAIVLMINYPITAQQQDALRRKLVDNGTAPARVG